MKARTVARHTRESFKSLLRNGWMTFASVSAVTITLILVGVFFVIMMNLNHVATSLEENVEIRVHIDVAATKEEKNALEEEIKAIPEVGSVIFSPKGEELNNLITSLGEDGDAFKLFEQDNPLNDVFVVKTKDPEDTLAVVKKIEKFEHAAKVRYGQGTVEKLFSAINMSRNVGIVLIIGLLFTAMFLISNTIKITIVARRKEIEIMRLVGATNWFIRWPFFLEGMWLGLLGSIIPIAAVSAIYYYAYQFLKAKLAGSYIKILDYTPFVFQVSTLLLVMGAVIGIWGSVMSIRKFLRV
ncbi:ABC transporter permease [Bacillus circulans]|jgi:cell division transport system permease protein|uniref:permease-like cell division protein FtsX n=1 Tax=Niallia circulans TaxID=1397 RepID=UPI0015612B1A|nr:permease-like cell division protein FtsX [Niallia circulans]NRG26350.1 ABC transporter permease [Niallia circulans]